MDLPTTFPSASPIVPSDIPSDSSVLRTTLRYYGSGFVVLMLLFCFMRRKYPLLYNIRAWSSMPGMATKLSKDQFGFISWAWKVWMISEDDMLQECGMDAICYLRALKFGFRICLVGMLNSLWLLPTYATGEINISDDIATLTINNLPEGSHRFVATVVAAYVFFGATIWLLEKEFEWFTDRRHKFLSEFNPRNYTCFVRNIPTELCDNDKLKAFFGTVFGRENVLEVHVDVSIPGLVKRCKERDIKLKKLEHAIARKNMFGLEKTTYRHNTESQNPHWRGKEVQALEAYTIEVEEAHESILQGLSRLKKKGSHFFKKKEHKMERKAKRSDTASITTLGTLIKRISFNFDDSQHLTESNHEGRLIAVLEASRSREENERSLRSIDGIYQAEPLPPQEKETVSTILSTSASITKTISFNFDDAKNGLSGSNHESRLVASIETSRSFEDDKWSGRSIDGRPFPPRVKDTEKNVQIVLDGMVDPPCKGSTLSSSSGSKDGSDKEKVIRGVISPKLYRIMTQKWVVEDVVDDQSRERTARENADFFTYKYDGKAKNAAFVTFTRISACQAARQLVQHHTPHVMCVQEAPDPREIYWHNVGISHFSYELGKLTVLCLSTCLLVAWTFPTVIISSLGNLDQLQSLSPWLKEWLETLPYLQELLAQLAPLFLLALNVWVLPEILRAVCLKEGHVSESSLEASVFFKVSVFTIIQTFFVSTVSGVITSSFSEITKNPETILKIVAEYLPLQSTYFLQLILVSTLFAVPWELLRFTYLGQAIGAANLGYHLTWKEKMRSKPLKMYSLEDPMEFQYRRVFSNDILYFVVLFTYGTMAPLITWFAAPCMLIMIIGYKHNYVYNYSKTPDSGGVLWLMFIRLVQVSILIGECMLLAYLIIKKAVVAWPLMIPIIIATLLHTKYLRQKHFWVADSLPAERCLVVDSELESRDFRHFRDEYVRPILKPTELVIDWEHGVSDRKIKEERKKLSLKHRIMHHAARFQLDKDDKDSSSSSSVSQQAGEAEAEELEVATGGGDNILTEQQSAYFG